MKTNVNILGTEYKIEMHKISEDKEMKENNWSGYCNEFAKTIIYADTSEEEYFPYMGDEEKKIYIKSTLRHEIIHAFLNESGLSDSANRYSQSWARNEEMVDWIAIQSPKINKVFQELELL